MVGNSPDGGDSRGSRSRNLFTLNLSDKAWAGILAATIGIGSTTAIVRTDPGRIVDRCTGEECNELRRQIDKLRQQQTLDHERILSLRRDMTRAERLIDRLDERLRAMR